ncbi:MAG TPA: type VI secretion system protein TssA [Geminicoccaceae bacterium]|nr:type VI secretion system protein TssA [Geminicoccaceae bacterium]
MLQRSCGIECDRLHLRLRGNWYIVPRECLNGRVGTMALSVASLVEPVAGDAPTGMDPAMHDGLYQTLQEAIKGRVEYKVVGKDEVRVFHPPDWRAVYDQALDCASRTRDLRVCIMLARAAAANEGPTGLTAGLELLRETCTRYWEELHPALDGDASDPGEQAFRRIAALNELSDRSGLLRDLRDMPILEARGMGRFGLRAIHLAQGKEAPSPGEEVPEAGLVQGALDNDSGLADTRAAIVAARQALGSLDQELRRRLDSHAPDLAPLGRTLDEMALALGADGIATSVQPAAAAPAAGGGPAVGASAMPAAATGDIASREQVVAALDRILQYYQQYEPASPIPLLLKRARRLVPMDFLDLMEDLAPAAVKQLKEIGGIGKKAEE